MIIIMLNIKNKKTQTSKNQTETKNTPQNLKKKQYLIFN